MLSLRPDDDQAHEYGVATAHAHDGVSNATWQALHMQPDMAVL